MISEVTHCLVDGSWFFIAVSWTPCYRETETDILWLGFE